MKITAAGAHRFFLGAHEGGRLKIGGVTVVDISTGKDGYQEGSGSIDLAPGLIPIEVTYYEGVGNAELQLSFVPPGGERQVVSPSLFVPNWQSLVAVTDQSGRFTLRTVPTVLEAIQVRATVMDNNRALSAFSGRVSPVPLKVVEVGDIVIRRP
jgi:hypothetical protein